MSKARNHEIDLLRGIACAAVVVFHFLYRGQQDAWIADAAPPALAQAARYGYLGVHLFFIISGYVIFMSMQGSTARGFVASRAARLYPAYWVAALLTTAVSWGLASELFPVRTRDLLINLTMLTHWLPLGLKVEYVDGAYWSLAVEFQFYLLMLLVMRAGWLARVEQPLTAWLALSTLDFFKRMYYPELWLALDWAPLFSAGILFYRIRHHGLTRRRYLLLWWSFVLALGHSTQPWEMAIGAPGDPPRSAWVVACALTAFFGLFSLIAADRWQMRGSALTVWAGALTYPVYLLHQNIGYMLLEAWREALPSFPLRLALVMAVVLVAAWAVHRGVERPLGPMLRRWIDPSRTRGRRPVRASALQPSS
ncbi:MAG: hypothetical protein RL456_2806 [Pseudomonadota bacterium]|jgi:peptidoglycan/LPS O-acetylase OafA/YrhL